MVRASRITHDEMLEIAGEKIADFCRGYKLYKGIKVHHDGMLIAGIIYSKLWAVLFFGLLSF